MNAAGSFALLEVDGLRKDFETHHSLIDNLRGRRRRMLTAVNDVSFEVNKVLPPELMSLFACKQPGVLTYTDTTEPPPSPVPLAWW